MQYPKKEYDSDKHDLFKALTVKQPFARDLVEVGYKDENHEYGIKSIEVRSKKTNYRGDLIITSSKTPEYPNMISGAVLGRVELYDVKHVKDFTPEDWDRTRIPHERRNIKKGYGWFFRNPRKIVEFPVVGQNNIWNLVFTKGTIFEYPKNVYIDKKAWKQLK